MQLDIAMRVWELHAGDQVIGGLRPPGSSAFT